MRIFNADGTEAGQCGNGVRCFALFARRRGLVRDGSFTVDTSGGAVRVEVESEGASGGRVSVDMGRPRLEPREIPFVAEARAPSYALSVGPETIRISAVSVGNPHAVLVVDDVAAAPVGRLGPRVQALGAFPQGVNVGFMQVLDPHRIRLRVYERGVGETLACGTGACAAVVAGRIRGLLEAEVEVELRGGRLEIGWTGEGESVRMTGPATEVFEGTIDL